MEILETLVDGLAEFIWGFGIPAGGETIPFIVILLLGVGLLLTVRLRLVQVVRFGHGVAITSGRYDDPADTGDVSHFQALSTALSATVGIGNIAGVAIALHWGGPGALFWMWLTAGLGMATKFTEVTLAQRYRVIDADHPNTTVAGGPMYYIERGLGASWRPLAVLFASLLAVTAFLTGNGVQANTVADTLHTSFGVADWVVGLVSGGTVGIVILGGIRRIGRVTSILAPVMAVTYVAAALVILALNASSIGPAFALILREAFNPSAGVAGTGVGAVLVTAMWGVKRGLFSNEAGQGSAPIAHAAAKTDEPVSEGVVALLEPFIDTLVICTMTALVIITTGMWEERVPTELQLRGGDLTWVAVDDDGVAEPLEELPRSIEVHEGRTEDGIALGWHDVPVERLYGDPEQAIPFTGRIDVERGLAIPAADDVERTSVWGEAVDSGAPLTMLAFRRGLQEVGDFGHYIVIVAVVLFGVSTAISWSYYGERCAHYVLGERAITPYRLIFVAMHFLGAIVPLSLAWTLGDAFMGIVIIPNLIALVLLSPQVAELTRSYFERKPWRQKKRGTG